MALTDPFDVPSRRADSGLILQVSLRSLNSEIASTHKYQSRVVMAKLGLVQQCCTSQVLNRMLSLMIGLLINHPRSRRNTGLKSRYLSSYPLLHVLHYMSAHMEHPVSAATRTAKIIFRRALNRFRQIILIRRPPNPWMLPTEAAHFPCGWGVLGVLGCSDSRRVLVL